MPVDTKAATDRLMRFLAIEGVTGQEAAIGRELTVALKESGVPAGAIRLDDANIRIPVPTETDFAGFTVDFKGSRDVAGFVVGAGLEYALLPNLSLKAEYNYFDFGTNGYTLNCSGNPACAATPLFPASVRQNMQTVMLGVNWRFNTGLAPLVARY